jgi:hypothetical protein
LGAIILILKLKKGGRIKEREKNEKKKKTTKERIELR